MNKEVEPGRLSRHTITRLFASAVGRAANLAGLERGAPAEDAQARIAGAVVHVVRQGEVVKDLMLEKVGLDQETATQYQDAQELLRGRRNDQIDLALAMSITYQDSAHVEEIRTVIAATTGTSEFVNMINAYRFALLDVDDLPDAQPEPFVLALHQSNDLPDAVVIAALPLTFLRHEEELGTILPNMWQGLEALVQADIAATDETAQIFKEL